MTSQERLELDALAAYMDTGRYDLAAERVGTTRIALQGRLARMRKRYGVAGSTIALIPVLAKQGLCTFRWTE